MPNYTKQLSIIILSYGSAKYLEQCLVSIREKIVEVEKEIIVVNNDKGEDLDFLREKFSEIVIMDSPENGGFGAGNNLGSKRAQGENLLFLNPDVEVVSDNIEEVIELFRENKKVGVIGSHLLTPSGETQGWSCGKEINIIELIKNNLRLPSANQPWLENKVTKVDWVSGTALFIRKELFEKLGGFDEQFFMYFEDMDLCARARKMGYFVLYYPYFSILHYGGKSYSDKKAQKNDYYNSQEYYFEKHCGIIQKTIIKIFRKMLLR